MPSQLDNTLLALGYAKVIVSLKTGGVATAAAGVQRDLEQKRAILEATLEKHFIIPNAAQADSLAAAAVNAASKAIRRVKSLRERRVRVYPHLGLALGFVDRQGAATLRQDDQVAAMVEAPELSLIRPTAAAAAKPAAAPTWGIKRLKVPRLWAAGLKGNGVLVGHIDTGVDGRHPALKGAIAKFAEFDLAGDQVANATPTDSGEHGTHTAGTIAGRPAGKTAFGVAPGAKLASAMVIEGGQVIDRVLAGMDWVLAEGARIMSMSLGLRGFTPAFQAVIDALRAQNVLPVIAVGNEGAETSRSPGNYVNVLSVGAMDEQNNVPDFSGSQHFDRPNDPLVPDLLAPGVDIVSCVPGNKFMTMDGSSMATPHIAGLAALLLQAKPDATAEALEAAIFASCVRPKSMPEARANRGVPDAEAAFVALTGKKLQAIA
jgi:subtilisin